MNRQYRLFMILVLFLLNFSVVNSAFAGDPISDAVEAIRSGERIYIAPGTVDDVESVKATIQRLLRGDDNIVLIILPESVITDTDINSIAEEISERLDDRYIIGLVVGRVSVGYATTLPVGVASDQMRRANSVSNGPVTALTTFVQNMHLWMDRYPELVATPTPTPIPTATPTPRPPIDPATASKQIFWVAVLVALILVSGLVVWLLGLRKRALDDPMYAKKLQDLKEASDALEVVGQYLEKVKDPKVSKQLYRIFGIADGEIVKELVADTTRANAATIFTIKEDLLKLEGVLELYTQILSGHLHVEEIDWDLQSKLETKFFPKVEAAFRDIADQLDRGDLEELDSLVRSLTNEFASRGYKRVS